MQEEVGGARGAGGEARPQPEAEVGAAPEGQALVAGEEEVEVHSQPIYTSSGLTEGTFVIDETLGRDTEFGILVEDEEDHLVRSVSFVDARGSAYGPYTKMSSTFDPVNLKTINYVGRAPPFGDVSIYIDRPSLFYPVL